MAAADVIDLLSESQRRTIPSSTSALAELALEKCEEMLMRGNWDRFGYWHAVYMSERARLNRKHHKGLPIARK